MYEARGVRGIECCRDLADDVDGARRCQRSGCEQFGECLSRHQSHVDVEMTVDLTPVVNGDHMRFSQDRRRTGFALEPGPKVFVVGVLVGQDFQRHGAPLLGVVGLVHLTHPAHAEHARDGVLAERRTDARIHPGSISRQASSGANSLRGTEIWRGPVLSAGNNWPSPKKKMTASSVRAKLRKSDGSSLFVGRSYSLATLGPSADTRSAPGRKSVSRVIGTCFARS